MVSAESTETMRTAARQRDSTNWGFSMARSPSTAARATAEAKRRRSGPSLVEPRAASRRAAISLDSRRPECAARRSAMRVRTSVSEGLRRQRWRRNPSLTEVRTLIAERLAAHSGLLESSEIAALLLAARGSTSEGPLRLRFASAVARAAVEGERAIEKPQFVESRCLAAVLIVSVDSAETIDWAGRAHDPRARVRVD